MKRRGRPPLPPSKRRNRTLLVRVNHEEYLKLARAAADGRQYIATYLRETGLGKHRPIVPALNQLAYAEFARIGGNLNQLAHHLNSGSTVPFPGPFPDLEGLQALLLHFRLALLGAAPDDSDSQDPEED